MEKERTLPGYSKFWHPIDVYMARPVQLPFFNVRAFGVHKILP